MKHPLHPVLVHFPVATWSLATAGDFAGLCVGEPAWRFAGVSMVLGLVTGVAAMAAGLAELAKLPDDATVIRMVDRHMLLAAAAWGCYAASLVLRLDGTTLQSPGPAALAVSATGLAVLVLAGHAGGRLVYEHAIGVRRPPA